MDLIIYEEADLTTARKPRAKKPMIFISARGKVSLNRQLLELLGVRTEDPVQPSVRIAFAQDRRRPQDWYVRLSEKGLAVRRCGRGWAVYSRILSAAVYGSVRGAEWPLRIPVSETADDGWYALITAAAEQPGNRR